MAHTCGGIPVLAEARLPRARELGAARVFHRSRHFFCTTTVSTGCADTLARFDAISLWLGVIEQFRDGV